MPSTNVMPARRIGAKTSFFPAIRGVDMRMSGVSISTSVNGRSRVTHYAVTNLAVVGRGQKWPEIKTPAELTRARRPRAAGVTVRKMQSLAAAAVELFSAIAAGARDLLTSNLSSLTQLEHLREIHE